MEIKKNNASKKAARIIAAGLPIIAISVAAFLPLPTVLEQLFIGVALVWFQVSLMVGVWS